MSEATPNMYKEGDWVHTQDGIGIVTLVFSHYYQYWEKSVDDKLRYDTYGDDEELATSMLGPRKEVGDWIKDIIYIKRLCDHDARLKKRIMCFQSLAYPNDGISAKEKRAVETILKDEKLAEKFHKHECQPRHYARSWNILVSPDKAALIQQALDTLNDNHNERLNMTMNEVEAYFKADFNVDIYEGLHKKLFANAIIQTQLLPENDPGFYNKDREEVICGIQIVKNDYDSDYLEKLCQAQHLDPDLYDLSVWTKAGWIDPQ